MVGKKSANAEPTFAGFVFQFERALVVLSDSGIDAAVAVEYLDDLSTFEGGRAVSLEQDKHTLSGRNMLADRSIALWRTLQLWLNERSLPENASLEKFQLVTNGLTNGTIASLLKLPTTDAKRAEKALDALKLASKGSGRKTKLQVIIDDVMARDSLALLDVLAKAELVDVSEHAGTFRRDIIDGFAIHPGVDKDAVLDALLGWFQHSVMSAWREKRPAIMTRQSCIRQVRSVESKLQRERLLPKAASDVPVSEEDRASALGRPFVNHLNLVEADRDDVLQAIDHFIQFGVERHRLALTGEIVDREWVDRGERLRTRWRNILSSAKRQYAGASAHYVGLQILERTTYEHYEPLGHERCEELYMTAGHYHRLADSGSVWWHPYFDPASTSK